MTIRWPRACRCFENNLYCRRRNGSVQLCSDTTALKGRRSQVSVPSLPCTLVRSSLLGKQTMRGSVMDRSRTSWYGLAISFHGQVYAPQRFVVATGHFHYLKYVVTRTYAPQSVTSRRRSVSSFSVPHSVTHPACRRALPRPSSTNIPPLPRALHRPNRATNGATACARARPGCPTCGCRHSGAHY